MTKYNVLRAVLNRKDISYYISTNNYDRKVMVRKGKG